MKEPVVWISLRDQYPPLWKKVMVMKYSDTKFIAYRTIFGNWKCTSGITEWISSSDKWGFIEK